MLIPFVPPHSQIAQTVSRPLLVLKLSPLVDETKLHLRDLGWESDVRRYLDDNGFQAGTSESSATFSFQPRVRRMAGGVYAFTTLGFLDVPGSSKSLRVFTATATRDPKDLGPGIRQAALDSTMSIASRLKEIPPGTSLQRILIPGAPQRLEGSDVIQLHELRVRVKPALPGIPDAARARGLWGEFRVALQIGSDGVPQRADVLAGNPELSLLALNYAMAWRFEPRVIRERSTGYRTELTVRFSPDTGLPPDGLPPVVGGALISGSEAHHL